MISTEWRRANPEGARRHREAERKRWIASPATRERHRKHNADFRARLKCETFDAYGGRFCNCCGESEFLFLSLDHIANNGNAERRKLPKWHGTGHAFYGYLKRRGYPKGYQVLCMNCNFGKRMNKGVCPHKK